MTQFWPRFEYRAAAAVLLLLGAAQLTCASPATMPPPPYDVGIFNAPPPPMQCERAAYVHACNPPPVNLCSAAP